MKTLYGVLLTTWLFPGEINREYWCIYRVQTLIVRPYCFCGMTISDKREVKKDFGDMKLVYDDWTYNKSFNYWYYN